MAGQVLPVKGLKPNAAEQVLACLAGMMSVHDQRVTAVLPLFPTIPRMQRMDLVGKPGRLCLREIKGAVRPVPPGWVGIGDIHGVSAG